MSDLREQLKVAKTKAYSLKTKKAQTKAWAKVREIEREILNGSYGGTLNETKYAELCKRNDLAFFKYPGSDGVTGLLSHKEVVS